MQGPSEKTDYGPDGVRVFNARAFLSHNAHIRARTRWSKDCRICSNGVEGFSDVDPKALAPGDLVQDSGGDKEGDAAPTPDSGQDWQERAAELLREGVEES